MHALGGRPLAPASGLSIPLLVLLSLPLAAQDPPPPAPEPVPAGRPRIGLVLAGGGARGAAHIGVLQVLEEMRIPIDAIAGTSMGAVVGGLAAIGYAPDELERTILSVDWSEAFNDRPPRESLGFRRKEEDRDFFAKFELGFRDGGIALPRGIISGQALFQILERLTNERRAPEDFDAFPIPFRAVACDLATGEAVPIASGDLAEALRASMSVPGVFTPVELDGRTLVDGGVVQNLPVATCRAMGVDVVIAVDLVRKPRTLRGIATFIDVSGQLMGLMMERTHAEQLALLGERDIRIEPAPAISSAGFTEIESAIVAGVEAARAMAAALAPLSLGEEEYARHRLSRDLPAEPPREVGEVRVVNGTGLADSVLLARLGIDPGDPFDAERIDRRIRELYGMSVFETIDYDLGPGDPADLTITATPRELGLAYLRFGAQYEDDLDGENQFNLATQLTLMPLDGYGLEWRTRAQVGQEIRLETELYQPLDPRGILFAEPRVAYVEDNLRLFSDGEPFAEYRVEASGVGFDLGAQLWNWGELRGGIEYFDGKLTPRTRDLVIPLPRVDFVEGSYRTALAIDTLDQPNFPTKGLITAHVCRFVTESLGSDDDFSQYQGIAAFAATIGRWTLAPSIEYGTPFEGDSSAASSFQLGGFLRLSGFAQDSRAGPNFLLARLLTYVSLGERVSIPARNELFLGGSFEWGNVADERSELAADDLVPAGSVFIGMESLLGPAYLGFGFAEGGEQQVFISFGPVF